MLRLFRDLIVAVIVLILKSVFVILSLGALAVLGYYMVKLVLHLGERIIPLWIIVYTFDKRLRTMAFLDSRFFKDGSSTYDRIENPSNYYLRLQNWEDTFSKTLIEYIPHIRNTSDFGRYPLPYGLFERDKLPTYLKKTFVWNVLLFTFCGLWLSGKLGSILEWFILVWMISILVGWFYMAVEKRNPKIRWKTRTRLKWINKDPVELCETLSWGVISRTYWLTKRRAKNCVYSVLGGLVLEGIIYVSKSFNLWEVLPW